MPLNGTGDLAGFAAANVNRTRLLTFLSHCIKHGVRYGFGAKAPHPGSGVVDFADIDCSGFVRAALKYSASAAMSGLPDGSSQMSAWIKAQGYKPTSYANAACMDEHVRLAAHHHSADEPIGHVWLIYHGMTLESYGGHGPGRRAWDTPVLSRIVDCCYVLC